MPDIVGITMRFSDLPAVVAEDILSYITRDGCLSDICRLRGVDRFFEFVATRNIAKRWLWKLWCTEIERLPGTLRFRLIELYLGELDRELDPFHTHSRNVVQFLVYYSPNKDRRYWLHMLSKSLDRCGLRDSEYHPIRTTGYVLSNHRGYTPEISTEHSEPGEPGKIYATSLMIAILIEDENLLGRMLDDGFSANRSCVFLAFPLNMACRLGLVRITNMLLAAGAHNHVRDMCPSALMHAVCENHPDIVDLLLHTSVYPPGESWSVWRVANSAARRNNRRVIEAMLNYNAADVAYSAIRMAAFNGWDDMLERLFELGLCDPEMWPINKAVGPPLVYAARGGHLTTCQLLLDRLPKRSQESIQLVKSAAYGGNVKVLKLILEKNMRMYRENDVPVIAATRGHLDMLKFALQRNYHTFHKDPTRLMNYALIAAIYSQRLEVTRYLMAWLQLDANVELLREGETVVTPLVLAIDAGSKSMVIFLSHVGASLQKSGLHAMCFNKQQRSQRYNLVFREPCDLKLMTGGVYSIDRKVCPGEVDHALREALLFCRESYDTNARFDVPS